MCRIGPERIVILTGLVVLSFEFNSLANGQTVGFQPQINPAFSGALVDVIPVVSADRRYARLSVGMRHSASLMGSQRILSRLPAGGMSGFTGGLMGMNGPPGCRPPGGGFGHVAIPGQGEGPLAGPFVSRAEFDSDGRPLAFQAGLDPGLSDWPRIMSSVQQRDA